MFSVGASKIANSARENVSRYGNIAGQKVHLKKLNSNLTTGHAIYYGISLSSCFILFVFIIHSLMVYILYSILLFYFIFKFIIFAYERSKRVLCLKMCHRV